MKKMMGVGGGGKIKSSAGKIVVQMKIYRFNEIC